MVHLKICKVTPENFEVPFKICYLPLEIGNPENMQGSPWKWVLLKICKVPLKIAIHEICKVALKMGTS